MSDADIDTRSDPIRRAPQPFGWSYPKLLLIVLVLTASVAVVVTESTSAAAFNAYNSEWDGTSRLHDLAADNGDVAVIASTDQYESVDPTTTTALVVAPESAYDRTEAARVRAFVEGGGTLVVADDFGSSGNQLLTDVGAAAQFNGALLRDRQNNFRTSAFPVANNVSENPTVQDVDQLTLNNGTAVEPNGARPIVSTASFGYLDPTGTDELSDATAFRNYPVVTVESVGEGTVIAVSDPSVFINSMLDRPDNEAFATTLVSSETTLLDASHTTPTPPLVDAISWLQDTPLAAAAVGVLVVGLVAAVGRRST